MVQDHQKNSQAKQAEQTKKISTIEADKNSNTDKVANIEKRIKRNEAAGSMITTTDTADNYTAICNMLGNYQCNYSRNYSLFFWFHIQHTLLP